MQFLIQHNHRSHEQLDKTLQGVQPYPHQFVGVIPFTHEITSDEPLTGVDYIPYGSTLFISIAAKRGWKGLYLNNSFSMFHANQERQDMLNQAPTLTVQAAIEYLRRKPKDELVFVRPDGDLKHFAGTVIDAGEAAAWFEDASSMAPDSGSYYMPPDMFVWVSTPKNIDREWRFFIVNGQVVSGSMYRDRGQLKLARVTDTELLQQAQLKAAGWLPHRNCVMDLALTDGELKVVEFNTLNASGFYDHDTVDIFKALYKDYLTQEGK